MVTEATLVLYVMTLFFAVAVYGMGRIWQTIAFKMAKDYATSPPPTPKGALVWYSGRLVWWWKAGRPNMNPRRIDS